MRCPECAEEIRDTARVCGYCGTRLIAAAPPPEPGPEPESEPEFEPELEPEPVAGPEALVEPKLEPEPARDASDTTVRKPGIPVRSIVIAVVVVLIAGAVWAVSQFCCAPEDGEDVAASTSATTVAPLPSTTAPLATTAPPQPTTTPTSVPSTGRTFDGVPILTTDELNVPRLDLLPPQLRGEFDGTYTCETYDTVEMSEGSRELLECRGSISLPERRYVVTNGWARDPGQSLDDVLGPQEAMFWLCIDDCAGGMNDLQNPIGYLEFNEDGDEIASPVYFVDLSGDHVLVAIWWLEGQPIVTSVTQVAFP